MLIVIYKEFEGNEENDRKGSLEKWGRDDIVMPLSACPSTGLNEVGLGWVPRQLPSPKLGQGTRNELDITIRPCPLCIFTVPADTRGTYVCSVRA
jgi:hypothetical protein